MSYNFKFGKYWISELGAVSASTPDYEIAQRDGDLVDIPGKDGSDYIDNGRYENVEFSRKIAFLNKDGFTAHDKAIALINEYAYLYGYHDFEDSEHENMVTQAVLQNFGDVNKELRQMNTATLRFSRKPYWFLKSGMEYTEFDLTASTPTLTLINPTLATSKPIFVFNRVDGASSVGAVCKITTGGVETSYDFRAVVGTSLTGVQLVVDCEKQTAVIKYSSGEYFANSTIPKLIETGETKIEVTTGKTNNSSISISPRWRCL